MTNKTSLVITLTLPEVGDETRTGRLLVARGDLARVHQFAHERIADLTEVIAESLIAFAVVAADPPVVADVPKLELNLAAPRKPITKSSAASVPACEDVSTGHQPVAPRPLAMALTVTSSGGSMAGSPLRRQSRSRAICCSCRRSSGD